LGRGSGRSRGTDDGCRYRGRGRCGRLPQGLTPGVRHDSYLTLPPIATNAERDRFVGTDLGEALSPFLCRDQVPVNRDDDVSGSELACRRPLVSNSRDRGFGAKRPAPLPRRPDDLETAVAATETGVHHADQHLVRRARRSDFLGVKGRGGSHRQQRRDTERHDDYLTKHGDLLSGTC
jgi:hypothetical protein